MKNSKLLFLIWMYLTVNIMPANGKNLPIKFFINGKLISGAKYYLITNHKGDLLKSDKDQLLLPDTLLSQHAIIVVYRCHHLIIPILPTDAICLKIYYDNRIFNNLANKESGGQWFKTKYFFKKKYLVSFGDGMVAICFPLKKNYKTRYHLN